MQKTLGSRIAELRKAQGLTQLELAEKMGVTDKAVSKWERDLSCPDINSLPKLAEQLGVSVEQLMQGQSQQPGKNTVQIIGLVLRAVALAMGIAVVVLNLLGKLDPADGIAMLGIGLAALALYLLQKDR